MKTKENILKALFAIFLFATSHFMSAQTVTQIKNLNLTEQECKDLIYTAKGTLAEEAPNLSQYIDNSQAPTITKYILHITVAESRALPAYHRFSGAKDGSIFYKILLPCSLKIFKEEEFEYPYVAILEIWEDTQLPFCITYGISGIRKTIY